MSNQKLAIEQERNRIAQEVHDTTGHTLTMINSLLKLIRIEYEKDGKTNFIEAEHIVIASGFRPNNALEDQLWGKVKDVRMIGDAVAPRKIITAVSEGYHYARLAN